MEQLSIPFLSLYGSSREIGRTHGEALRPLIRDTVETYFAVFKHYATLFSVPVGLVNYWPSSAGRSQSRPCKRFCRTTSTIRTRSAGIPTAARTS